MATNEKTVDEMTSIIYKHIFDLTQDEAIRIARRKAGNWSLDDEGFRDMLSIEALEVLAEIGGACAVMYEKINRSMRYAERLQAMRAITHHIASQYHVEHMWRDELEA